MFVDVEAGGGKFGTFATASIDPAFSFATGVDPAYSFQFSEGIGNSSIPTVPEPRSVVLLCTGAIAIGLLRRRFRLRRLATPGGTETGSFEASTGQVAICEASGDPELTQTLTTGHGDSRIIA